MAVEISNNYIEVLQSLKEKIRQSRIRATVAVNNELLGVYWEIGNTILLQQKNEGWGTKVIDRLVADLKLEFPDMKGLSPRNIKYMRTFAQAFPHFVIVQGSLAQLQSNENKNDIIVQQPVAQLPWGHICTLLDKLKTNDERHFYAQKTIQNGWTRDMLVNQIETGLYKRQGALTNNFQLTLPNYESELAIQLFKDPYHLDFVMLGEAAKERDLENALMNHITKLLLELGDGFAFMGRQKRFEAGGKEFFIDLLFYNTKLRRHIIIDLKIGDFEPEYVSKMNVYLGLADDELKGEYDQPAIGLILCKTNNKIVAEYALRDTSKPIGIAEYKIAQMLPEDIKGELPSIEEIETRLDEELKEQNSPVDARLNALKEKIKNLTADEIQTPATFAILSHLYTNSLRVLYIEIIEKLKELDEYFYSKSFHWYCPNCNFNRLEEADVFWKEEQNLKNTYEFNFQIRLDGFKKAGTSDYCNIVRSLHLKIGTYHYSILLDNNSQMQAFKKLYPQQLTSTERKEITGLMMTAVMNDMEDFLKRIKEDK